MKKLLIFPALLSVLFCAGCHSFQVPEPQGENVSTGISYAWKNNEIFLIRGKEYQEISAFHPVSDVQFFSAKNAPVLVAATLEAGYPGRTVLRIVLPPADRKLTSADLLIVDPVPLKKGDEKPVIQKVTGISEDGNLLNVMVSTSLKTGKETVRGAQSAKPAKMDLRTGKLILQKGK